MSHHTTLLNVEDPSEGQSYDTKITFNHGQKSSGLRMTRWGFIHTIFTTNYSRILGTFWFPYIFSTLWI